MGVVTRWYYGVKNGLRVVGFVDGKFEKPRSKFGARGFGVWLIFSNIVSCLLVCFCCTSIQNTTMAECGEL